MSDNTPTHYKGFTIKHNAPMTDEYYVVGNLSFYKTVDDAKRSIDGLLGNDTPTSLREILEDMLLHIALVPHGAGQEEALDEAIAAITALIPEKYPPDSGFKKDEGYYHDVGFNEAINTIQRNFTGQTDNERSKYE